MVGGDGSFAKTWKDGLRILTTNDAPYNFKDSSGKMVGIDAEIVAETTKRLKFPRVEYVEGPWESMVPNLQSNRGDLLQTNIHFTQQRAEVIDFTGPVYFYGDYLVVKKGNPLNLHKWEDLKGHSVGAIRGENYVDWLNKRGDLKEVKTYKTFDEEIADLAAGRTDAMIGDEVVYAYYLVQHPDAGIELAKDYVPQTDLADWTRFGVQKGAHDLANAYTRVLDEMRVDGTTAKILAKYGIDKHALQVIHAK